MYAYITGIITQIESSYIVLEQSGVGYLLYTPNPYAFSINQECTIYIYQHVREDEISLYGFKTKEEKDMFLKLINVKGLGCKMALPMLATGSIEGIIDAIKRENILYLKKFPKIGDKVARQIILDLKGHLVANEKAPERVELNELVEVLKGLGYKHQDITKVLPNIDGNSDIENQIKQALRLLLK